MHNFLTRYGISPRYPGSKIRQNFGTGCGNGTGNGIRDEKSWGRGTVVKKRAECGIRTPLPDPDVTGFA